MGVGARPQARSSRSRGLARTCLPSPRRRAGPARRRAVFPGLWRLWLPFLEKVRRRAPLRRGAGMVAGIQSVPGAAFPARRDATLSGWGWGRGGRGSLVALASVCDTWLEGLRRASCTRTVFVKQAG